MASGSRCILEGVCRVMNAKGKSEVGENQPSGRQAGSKQSKRSLWQSNKKKRAKRIGKQIKTFLREDKHTHCKTHTHTHTYRKYILHTQKEQKTSLMAVHHHTLAQKNARLWPKQKGQPELRR